MKTSVLIRNARMASGSCPADILVSGGVISGKETLCSATGNELLEVWYYGDLLAVKGETQSYIVDSDEAPGVVAARDPVSYTHLDVYKRQLRKELEKLNHLAWQADEDTILGWADTEGYPVDGTLAPDGQYSKADIPEHTRYDTQSLAKFAFSMFWRAMRFAEEHQVPILLDY